MAELSPKSVVPPALRDYFPEDTDACLDGRITRDSTVFPQPGGYADVYIGLFENQKVAIKVIRPFKLQWERLLQRLWREYQIWASLSHPNILPCLGYSSGFSMGPRQLPSLVSPWMENGTITSYLQNHPEVYRVKLLTDVAKGLSYMHTREPAVVHGDLRAGNILVSDQGVAFLADFGLSRALQEVEGLTTTSQAAGSRRWMSPELFEKNAKATVHSDTWAYGMTILEVLSGKRPYFTEESEVVVIFEIMEGKIPPRPFGPDILEVLDDKIWSICKLCWSWEPNSRPSIQKVAPMISGGCQDEFLSTVDHTSGPARPLIPDGAHAVPLIHAPQPPLPAPHKAAQCAALPAPSAPLGVIACFSLEGQDDPPRSTKRNASVIEVEDVTTEDAGWGVANRAFFQSSPSMNITFRTPHSRKPPPAIIAKKLISWAEAETLFELFYEFVNPHVSLFDPALHTCTNVVERCPFLFTVVCAISLRYDATRQWLHREAMKLAKIAAATALIEERKSIELVQGYYLLSVYGLPARQWEEDRSWVFGGLATRIAVDIGLNNPTGTMTHPLSERHERELRNRVRTWLICFNLDRSSAIQFGKPSGIHDEVLVDAAREWCRGPYSHPNDLNLVMHVELLRIMSRFYAQVYVDGVLNKNCDFRAVTEAAEVELSAWHDDIMWQSGSVPRDSGNTLRTEVAPFFENYMRLVMYSFGFQDAWKRRRVEHGDMFFPKCLQAASAGVRQVVDVLGPSGFLRYAPEGHFVMAGFCAAFLLKMLRPEFQALLDDVQRARITGLVRALVGILASPRVAVDEGHTPKLYARFLAGQLCAVDVANVRKDAVTEAATPGTMSSSTSFSVPTPTSGMEEWGEGWNEDEWKKEEMVEMELDRDEY